MNSTPQGFYAIIKATNKELERAVLKSEFAKFGVVRRIFMNTEKKFAKVYFDSEESVKEACKHLNGKHNMSVMYLRNSNNNSEDGRSVSYLDETEDIDICSNSSQSLVNGIDEDSDIEDVYVDCHGRPVEVLEGENGKLYVNLDHVRRAGFEVFLKDSYDNAVITQENDLKQFTNFMLNQGMRYALKYKKTFDEKEVCNTFEKVRGILEKRSCNKRGNSGLEFERIINVDSQSRNLVITKNTYQTVNDNHKSYKHLKNTGSVKKKNRAISGDRNRIGQKQELIVPQKQPLGSICLETGANYKIKVTSVIEEKNTVFYAQLLDNQTLVQEITAQVNTMDSRNDEIKKTQEQTIGIAYYNNSWYRSRVIKANGRQNDVRLLDFGDKVNVCVPLRYLSKKSRWPAQAIKMVMCNRESHVVQKGEELEVVIKKVYDDAFLVSIKDNKKDNSEPCFTQIPPASVELKPGELVIILGFSKNHLTLRNLTCVELSKQLYKYLNTFNMVPIKNPKVGQVVLAPKEELEGLHRAVLKRTTYDMAEIEYIDYCGGNTVPLTSLRNVDDNIASISSSKIISPPYSRLKDLDETGIAFLNELILKKTKLNVVLGESHFDLLYDDGSTTIPLSEKINKNKEEEVKTPNLETKQLCEETVVSKKEPSDVSPAYKSVTLSDMTYVKLEKGNDMYLCYSCSGRSVTLLKTSEEFIEYIAQLEINDMDDKEPFAPEVEQMCMAKHEDSWYRATVLDRNPDGESFEILFVDYGNINTVQKENLRKLPVKLASIPVLGVSAYFQGIPNNQKVHDRIKELLPDDSILDINVKTDINEDFEYGIEIESIYNKLKEEKLL